METKSFIYKDLNRVGLSTYDMPGIQKDETGGVAIYFGPEPPEGFEFNWIPTGEDFYLLFRFYEPNEAVFDKSFVLPDIERID